MISEFRCSEKRGALPKSEKIVNLRRTGPRLHASPTLATFFLQLEQFLTSRDGVASQFKGLRLLPRHDRNIWHQVHPTVMTSAEAWAEGNSAVARQALRAWVACLLAWVVGKRSHANGIRGQVITRAAPT